MPATSNLSQEVAAEVNRPSQHAMRAKRTIRSRPTVGRTIEVNPEKGGDFGRALRGLSILCAVNKIKQDKQRQRFHERPGLKRKRLKSERWRRLFKQSFKAAISRVREMKRKGW
jgi:ribosomal protein S21